MRRFVMPFCFVALVVVHGCGESHGPFDGAVGDAGALDGGWGARDAGPMDAGDAGDLDSGADAGPSLQETFIEFCVRIRMLQCVGGETCCTQPGRPTSSCAASHIRSRCEERGSDPALRDGTLLWRPEAARMRIEELESSVAGCDAINRAFSFGNVLLGTLGEGADCTPYLPGLRSVGRFRCEAGLRCELTGSLSDFAGVCAEPGSTGSSCNHDCGEGLFCQWSTDPNPFWGYCMEQDDGARCISDYGCSGMLCVLDSCVIPEPGDTWCGLQG